MKTVYTYLYIIDKNIKCFMHEFPQLPLDLSGKMCHRSPSSYCVKWRLWNKLHASKVPASTHLSKAL